MKEKFIYNPCSVRLTVEQLKALKQEATEKCLTVSDLIREKLFGGVSHV